MKSLSLSPSLTAKLRLKASYLHQATRAEGSQLDGPKMVTPELVSSQSLLPELEATPVGLEPRTTSLLVWLENSLIPAHTWNYWAP